MFFSLNKKFFVTILAFFLLFSAIFIVIFDGIIGKKIRAEHSSIVTRNQYVIDLLNENINLRRTLRDVAPSVASKNLSLDLRKKQEELNNERRLNEDLNQNYNENYATLSESLRIISLGAILTMASLIILWFLLRRWVIFPLDKLTILSIAVANGDFSQRFKIRKNYSTDEFDTLMNTINFMLDNIESNINEIKQKELFLQNLIDALPDAIRIIDNNYNVTLSNKTYNLLIKKNDLSLTEKCYQDYQKDASCPCNPSQYICPLQELKKNKKNNAVKLIHSINNKPFSVNSARINFNGMPAIVESIRDLSENIHYSHQQKISSLAFLSTSLAHEMKNNLGAINLILSGILQKYYSKDTKNNEEKKYLEMISTQIDECLKIPERLLKLARNNNQTSSVFDTVSGINDILSLLDYEIKRKGINLITEYTAQNSKLKGNETDFKMVILNLIQNAINAMPEGGDLTVSITDSQTGLLSISVKDTGCGIEPSKMKHIFEPFYSSSDKQKKEGTGLGLAIVKDVINKFNAEISVTSKVNEGSLFEITFPQEKS